MVYKTIFAISTTIICQNQYWCFYCFQSLHSFITIFCPAEAYDMGVAFKLHPPMLAGTNQQDAIRFNVKEVAGHF